MKRHILTLCLAAASLAGAATASAQQLRLGVGTGANINYLTVSQDILTKKFGYGYSAGARAEYMFPGIGFGLDMGLLYTQRASSLDLGSHKMWKPTTTEPVWNLTMHNIDVPINLKFKYTRLNGVEDVVAPFVFGGPMFAFNIGHTASPTVGESDIRTFNFPAVQVYLSAGAGVELYRHWQVAGAFSWGMTNAFSSPQKILDGYNAVNRTIDLRVSYLF